MSEGGAGMGERPIVLVGYGNMGRALARGWIDTGREPKTIYVTDTSDHAHEAAMQDGVSIIEASQTPPDVAVVVLAVKPQQIDAALEQHRKLLICGSVLLSIVAGKPLGYFEARLGTGEPIVRAMPNTPAAISQGMTVLCANAAASSEARDTCATLMRAVGDVAWVDDESLMDAVTAISGSGPAYVFLLIESLAQAGAKMGLDPDLSLRLAAQTVAGSGAYAKRSTDAPADLRRKVTSPGGTTEAALDVLLARGGLLKLMEDAVEAATKRSRELSED